MGVLKLKKGFIWLIVSSCLWFPLRFKNKCHTSRFLSTISPTTQNKQNNRKTEKYPRATNDYCRFCNMEGKEKEKDQWEVNKSLADT